MKAIPPSQKRKSASRKNKSEKKIDVVEETQKE